MPDSTRYIGLDLSLSATGIVILDGSGLLMYQDIITTPPQSQSQLYFRIENIVEPLKLALLGFGSAVIAIETPHGGLKGGTVMQLAALAYAVRSALREEHVIINVAPTQVKQFACGSGAAKKEMMLKTVYRKWGFDTDDNNLADAYALAQIARATVYAPTLQYEQALLEKIRLHHKKSIWS